MHSHGGISRRHMLEMTAAAGGLALAGLGPTAAQLAKRGVTGPIDEAEANGRAEKAAALREPIAGPSDRSFAARAGFARR